MFRLQPYFLGVGLQIPAEMIVSGDRQELNNSEGYCVKKKSNPI